MGIEPGTIWLAQLGLSLLLIPSPLNKAASLFTHQQLLRAKNLLKEHVLEHVLLLLLCLEHVLWNDLNSKILISTQRL